MALQGILYDSHMHTPLCKHAVGEPEEYAAAGLLRGLRGITITCHNPVPGGWARAVRMEPEEFPEYVAVVQRAREAWAGRIDVRLGLESDFMPGMEPWLEKLHARADFSYLLGSIHPHLSEYKARYPSGDPAAFQSTYFGHLADAAETGLFDCLSHPDLVKNMFPTRWNLDAVMDAIRRSLDRIARAGTAMELNTSGLDKQIQEMNPGPRMLKEMRARNIPVVIGSDAHKPERVADDFKEALDNLEEAGYTEVSFFIERKRQTVAIAEARASLKPVTA